MITSLTRVFRLAFIVEEVEADGPLVVVLKPVGVIYVGRFVHLCLVYLTLALISSAASRDQRRIIPLSEVDIKG